MAGSSSDSAGPAAFAAMQAHNRETTIAEQAKEIKGLKRKVELLTGDVADLQKIAKRYILEVLNLRTRFLDQIDAAELQRQDQQSDSAIDTELTRRTNQIAPNLLDDRSEEEEEEPQQGDEEEQQEQ